MRGREIITALQKAGFEVIRSKGSHHFLRHPDGRGEIIGPGLMSKILNDVELTVEVFLKYLR
jgi:predicted RNA binding protein YcfA (HicA-like mRNA interferase family)